MAISSRPAWRRHVVPVLLVGVAAAGASGCSVIRAAHAVISANHDLNQMTAQLQKSENAKFEVTYETTGSSPSTVTYAASPPSEFSYVNPGTNGGAANELIENASGFYTCSGQSGSSSWQCVKLAASQQANYSAAFQVYTGAYWFAILDAYSSVAALAGVKIVQTSKTVNGFHLTCLVITASSSGQSTANGNNTGTYCVTQQGVLGYVAASGNSSVFEIKSYKSPPPASDFQLPAGATITTLPAGTASSVPGGTGTSGGGTTSSTTTTTSSSIPGATGTGAGGTGVTGG